MPLTGHPDGLAFCQVNFRVSEISPFFSTSLPWPFSLSQFIRLILFCQGSICCLTLSGNASLWRFGIPPLSPERSQLPSPLPTLRLSHPFLDEPLWHSHLFQMPLLQSFTPEDNFSSTSLCRLSCAKTFAVTPAGTLQLSKASVTDLQVLSIFGWSSSVIKKGYNNAACKY